MNLDDIIKNQNKYLQKLILLMLDQKKLLIQSMKKLIIHISNNKQHQNEIYRSLTKNDIQKILINLEDNNITLRKISARLLCQLLYQNQQIKQMFMNTMNINPMYGNIVLNKFPQNIKNNAEILMPIIKFIKTVKADPSFQNICWYIQPDKPEIKYQYLHHNIFMNDFLDPSRIIFGIIFYKTQHKSKMRNQIQFFTPSSIKNNTNIHNNFDQIQLKKLNLIKKSDLDTSTNRDQYRIPINYKLKNLSKRQDHGIKQRSSKIILQSKVLTFIKQTPQNSTKRYTQDLHIYQNRIKTDQSDNGLAFKNKPQTRIISPTTNSTSFSPQNQNFIFFDKILKEKGTNKQDKTILIGGVKSPFGYLNGIITQRSSDRQGLETKIIDSNNFMVKGSLNSNYAQQYSNYTKKQTRQIQDNKLKIQQKIDHAKFSQIFLRKIKQSKK